MDGSSTDSSLDIIKKHAGFLTSWQSQKDNGQAHAINKGWQRATGDIIGWINSDDLLYPGSLEAIGRFFAQNPDIDFVHGHCIHFDDKRGDWIKPEEFIPTDQLDPYKLKLDYLAGFPYAQPACFFRREVLDQIGMLDEDFFFTMDYDLFIRIALNFKMQSIDHILAKFRVHPGSKSANYEHIRIKERNKAFSKLVRTMIALEEGNLESNPTPLTPSLRMPMAKGEPHAHNSNRNILTAGWNSPLGAGGASEQMTNTSAPQLPNSQHANKPIRQHPNHPKPKTQNLKPKTNTPTPQYANHPKPNHPYIHLLKPLNLYQEGTDTYPIINCQYNQEAFKDVVANFLWLQAFEHHKHLRIEQSKPLLKALGQFAPDFLQRYDDQYLYWKNRWLNKSQIKAFRHARLIIPKLLKTKPNPIRLFKTFY